MSRHATAEDFAAWSDRAEKATFDEINFVIRDCQEAGRRARGFDPVAEGFYSDQASVYHQELVRRREKRFYQEAVRRS